MKIVYLCNWDGASGGIKVLYDHVRILRTRGFDANLGATSKFRRCIWFDHEPEEIPAVEDVFESLTGADWLVVPEFVMHDPRALQCTARKAVFIQNHSLVPPQAALAPFEAVMTASLPIANWVRRTFPAAPPVDVFEGFLEDEWIGSRVRWQGGPVRALITPRRDKNRGEPLLARDELRRLRIATTTMTDFMHRNDFARLFRCHPVYLHLSYPEGFPNPVLEAFGAGCLVIGFAGMGGLHFMEDGANCLIAADGDWQAVVRMVQHVHRSEPGAYDVLLAGARATARHYDERRLSDRLAAFFADSVSLAPAQPRSATSAR